MTLLYIARIVQKTTPTDNPTTSIKDPKVWKVKL
jgi:hypothetical protein